MHRINRMGGFVDKGVDPDAPEGIYAQLPGVRTRDLGLGVL